MKLPNITAALVAVVPASPKPEPAPFAGLCRSLAKRKAQVTEEFYLGAVRHLVERFRALPGNERGGHLYSVFDRGMTASEVVEGCGDAAKWDGDVDGRALCDLLLTLTDEQREAL